MISPLTAIVELSPDLPAGDWPDVIFTSENAVRAFERLSAGRTATAWCVGVRTAAAAAAAGFRTRTGPGDVSGLFGAIVADGTVARLLYPRPVHAAGNLEKRLNSAGIETKSILTYDQKSRPPTPEALGLMAGAAPVLLPLFSPRSAALAAGAFATDRAPLWVAAISDATATAAAALVARRCVVAVRPNAEAMLDAIGELIDAAKMG